MKGIGKKVKCMAKESFGGQMVSLTMVETKKEVKY